MLDMLLLVWEFSRTNRLESVSLCVCVMCCVCSPGGTVHDIVSEILIY